MKGVIVACLKELVEGEFGKDKWEAVLEGAGVANGASYLPISDVDDAVVMKLVSATCSVLGITQQQAADAFGRQWACSYAPKMYGAYFIGIESAKEFLLKLDGIHVSTTRAIINARPPRFVYEDLGGDALTMEYHSDRALMPFFVGLVKGLAEHYGEKADITPLSATKVKIVLSQA